MSVNYYRSAITGAILVPAICCTRSGGYIVFYDYTIAGVAYKLRHTYGARFSKLVYAGKINY